MECVRDRDTGSIGKYNKREPFLDTEWYNIFLKKLKLEPKKSIMIPCVHLTELPGNRTTALQ